MRRLEAERIDGVPASAGHVWRIPGKPGIRSGWGRRCGLGALSFRPPTPSVACGASRRSGCGARAPCLARTAPGRLGAPPGWVLRPAREELADGSRAPPSPRSAARCRSSSHGRRGRSPRVERREASASGHCLRRLRKLVCVARGRASGIWMRLAALRFPRVFGEGRKDDGVPGAAKQIRAAKRWLRADRKAMRLNSVGAI